MKTERDKQRQREAYKRASLAKLERSIHRKRGTPAPAHQCRRCNCTNVRPCQSVKHGPCYWVTPAENLCSACAMNWPDVTREPHRCRGSAKQV
jgi:hypothetical protein